MVVAVFPTWATRGFFVIATRIRLGAFGRALGGLAGSRLLRAFRCRSGVC